MVGESFPIRIPVILVKQPLSDFYITKIPAKTLLEITFSDPLRVREKAPGGLSYFLSGSQRRLTLRTGEIEGFIKTVEAAFPNSIILGGNYRQDGNLEDDPERRWTVEADGDVLYLNIPKRLPLASIIDGQHRLMAFERVDGDRKDMELLCSIYLDLPNAFQALLFATINFNQKKVDRSQAYELFGFDLEDEPENSWSPDKAAVYIARRLNMNPESAFRGHITIAAQDINVLGELQGVDNQWKVSMATVVDGLIRLFSKSPRNDKDALRSIPASHRRNRNILPDDGTPFRTSYKAGNDKPIETAVLNFFSVVNELLWSNANDRSYIRKTVGIQALFDVLLELMHDVESKRDISKEYFRSYLSRVTEADFSREAYQASGIGRSRIRKAILEQIGIAPISE